MTTDKGRPADWRSAPLGEGRPRGGERPMTANRLRTFRVRPVVVAMVFASGRAFRDRVGVGAR